MATVSLKALIADRKPLTVPLNGKPLAECGEHERVRLVYRPSAVNLAMEVKSQEMRAQGKSLLALADTMADLLVEWNITDPRRKTNAEGEPLVDALGEPIYETDANGKVIEDPVPISTEVLGTLGLKRLSDWHGAVLEDMFPNVRSAAFSGDG